MVRDNALTTAASQANNMQAWHLYSLEEYKQPTHAAAVEALLKGNAESVAKAFHKKEWNSIVWIRGMWHDRTSSTEPVQCNKKHNIDKFRSQYACIVTDDEGVTIDYN